MPLANADIFKNSVCQAKKYAVTATPQAFSLQKFPHL